jgi:hypothetical protein
MLNLNIPCHGIRKRKNPSPLFILKRYIILICINYVHWSLRKFVFQTGHLLLAEVFFCFTSVECNFHYLIDKVDWVLFVCACLHALCKSVSLFIFLHFYSPYFYFLNQTNHNHLFNSSIPFSLCYFCYGVIQRELPLLVDRFYGRSHCRSTFLWGWEMYLEAQVPCRDVLAWLQGQVECPFDWQPVLHDS